jgi:hypothetical protein
MLRMQEMAFPGFKFQKFSGGACPLTPLEFVVPPNFRIMLQSDFKLDPPLYCILCRRCGMLYFGKKGRSFMQDKV